MSLNPPLTPASACLSAAVNSLCPDDDESQLLSKLLGDDQDPCTQFRSASIKWQPIAVSEVLVTDAQGRCGGSPTYVMERITDACIGATLVMECPQICSPRSVVSAVSASSVTNAALYTNAACPYALDLTTGCTSVVTLGVAAVATGTAAVITGTFVPQYVFLDLGAVLSVAGDSANLTFGADAGTLSLVCQVGAAGAAISRYVVVGSTGSLVGTPVFTDTKATPSTWTTATHEGIAVGTYTWAVTTAGSGLNTLVNTLVANADVYTGWTAVAGAAALTLGDVITISSAAELTFSDSDITQLTAAADSTACYYVNGAPLAAIEKLTLKMGSATPYCDVNARDLRVAERISSYRSELNQGRISNFGTQQQLQRYAHKLATQTTQTASIPVQRFMYDLGGAMQPFRQIDSAVLLNAQQNAASSIRITFAPVTALVRGSATKAHSTQGTVNCLFGDHRDSFIAVNTSATDASVIKFHMLYTYATSKREERAKFASATHYHILSSVNPGYQQRQSVTSVGASNAYSTQTFDIEQSHPATWLACAIQPTPANRETTNGLADIFSYRVGQAAGTAAAESQAADPTGQLFVPALEAMTVTVNGAPRVEDYNHELSAVYARKHLPNGAAIVIEDGVIFYPLAPQKAASRTDIYGTLQQSAAEKYKVKVHYQPALVADGQFMSWSSQHLMLMQTGGCVSQAFL